jgi:hypothetical protein
MIESDHSNVQAMNARNEHAPRRGAYGFWIVGVPGADALLVDAPLRWPRLEVDVVVTSKPPPARERVDETTAVLLPRSGGWVSMDRTAGRATLSLPARPAPGALVHPHLASVAVVSAHWLGRETFHAGGFVAGGKAWGLLGEKEAGKSSFLASLSREGIPILCDDVLVLDDLTALAGPRSIDLRPDAATRIGAGEPMGVVGTRERWRLALEPISAELPLGGWVTLGWGEETSVRPLRGSDRLVALGGHRATSLYPPRPETLIELSSLPMIELQRPRRWDLAAEVAQRLLAAVG